MSLYTFNIFLLNRKNTDRKLQNICNSKVSKIEFILYSFYIGWNNKFKGTTYGTIIIISYPINTDSWLTSCIEQCHNRINEVGIVDSTMQDKEPMVIRYLHLALWSNKILSIFVLREDINFIVANFKFNSFPEVFICPFKKTKL